MPGVNKPLFLIVVSISFISAQNAVVMLPPLLNDIGKEFGVSDSVVGQLATATFAGWAIAAIMVGPLSDSFGRRPVAVSSLFLMAVGVFAAAFAPNLAVLMVMRALTGLSGGGIPPNSMAAVVDVISPERRSQTVGALMAIVMLAGAVSVPLLTLLADWLNWRYALAAWGMVLTSGFLLNWLWFPAGNRERIRNFSFFSRYRVLLAMRFFQAAITANVSHRIAFWAMFTYMVIYLKDAYGVSTGAAAAPVLITAVWQGIGSYVGGSIARMRNRGIVLAVLMLAGGLCGLAFFAFAVGFWASVALASVGSGLLSVMFPAMIAMSTEVSGESRATGVGLMGLTNQLGGIGGAALGGVLLASVGYEAVGFMCLGMTVVSALAVGLFIRRPTRYDG